MAAHLTSKPLDIARDWLQGRMDGVKNEAADAEERIKKVIKEEQQRPT